MKRARDPIGDVGEVFRFVIGRRKACSWGGFVASSDIRIGSLGAGWRIAGRGNSGWRERALCFLRVAIRSRQGRPPAAVAIPQKENQRADETDPGEPTETSAVFRSHHLRRRRSMSAPSAPSKAALGSGMTTTCKLPLWKYAWRPEPTFAALAMPKFSISEALKLWVVEMRV